MHILEIYCCRNINILFCMEMFLKRKEPSNVIRRSNIYLVIHIHNANVIMYYGIPENVSCNC